jgi:site-specific DNA-methyltransferase (adenine-specific)
MNIIHGDSLDKLKELEDNSVDSIVTDPPYGLSFMGKKWDYDVPSQEIWKECLRVLKPGGYLLAFAGTRTQHRMAVRIEDAGFEIRDMIAWVYGSGFPKSLNIGKAVDKLQGNERKILGERKVPDQRSGGINSQRTAEMGVPTRMTTDTKGNSPYEGWGTALKPALEPITVARKPISEKTVAQNVLKYGTGGINIDGCRVGTETILQHGRKEKNGGGWNNHWHNDLEKGKEWSGRFPANLIHDGSDEVVGLFPESKTGSIKPYISKGSQGYNGGWNRFRNFTQEASSGSASRFFYCAKASKAERNRGLEELKEKPVHRYGSGIGEGLTPDAPSFDKNHHPTVKPISLMRYLCRLVTPKGGTVLDPFMGSGTTGIGAKLEGFDFIGIEREEEYIKIAEARINAWEEDKQKKLIG